MYSAMSSNSSLLELSAAASTLARPSVPGPYKSASLNGPLFVDHASPLHRIRIASYNRAHPIPTLMDMRTFQDDRFLKQNSLLQNLSDVSLTQETTRYSFNDMIKSSEGISPDYQKKEELRYRPKTGKRAWTGLAIFCKPEEFKIDKTKPAKFSPYGDEHQKSWKQVGEAFTRFLYNLFSSGIEPFHPPTDLRRAFKDLINAFSGPARTDGILKVHLTHRSTGREFIVCTTHLESFDANIRSGQIESMIDMLRAIKRENPNATIVFGGDFNFEQCDVVAYEGELFLDAAQLFKHQLGAIGIEDCLLTPTMKNAVIDNIFVIPPVCEENPFSDVNLLLAEPPLDYEDEGLLSDHKMILRHLELN